MKRSFSLSHFLHNDKLMMLVSLLLAILVWAIVVFGPSNTQEQVISGVPISVTLNDYAGETLNLRIVSGAESTATVKVKGLRSVVSRLSAVDINITADTGNVIKEGTYTLPLRVVSNGDYTIQSVVGPDGKNDTVTISCDVWREAFFPVSVETPNLTVTDNENYQIGTPVIDNGVLTDGQISLSGPRSDINRINEVVAIISEQATINESQVYMAQLEARDATGKVIDTITYSNAQDGKVSVTVPVLVYREVSLTPTALNVPADYASNDSLVTVMPSKFDLWGLPSEIDDYIARLQQQLTVDFNKLAPNELMQVIPMEANEAIRPVNGEKDLTLKVNLNNIVSTTFEITLNESNFVADQLPDGYKMVPKQTKATVTLCGPSYTLINVRASDIRLTASMSKATAGLQTVPVKVSVPNRGNVWAYYGDAEGVDVLVSVEVAE